MDDERLRIEKFNSSEEQAIHLFLLYRQIQVFINKETSDSMTFSNSVNSTSMIVPGSVDEHKSTSQRKIIFLTSCCGRSTFTHSSVKF